jgi:hypothetical protein
MLQPIGLSSPGLTPGDPVTPGGWILDWPVNPRIKSGEGDDTR